MIPKFSTLTVKTRKIVIDIEFSHFWLEGCFFPYHSAENIDTSQQ